MSSKSSLQELYQGKKALPEYATINQNGRFISTVTLFDKSVYRGIGATKKEAEKAAASAALTAINGTQGSAGSAAVVNNVQKQPESATDSKYTKPETIVLIDCFGLTAIDESLFSKNDDVKFVLFCKESDKQFKGKNYNSTNIGKTHADICTMISFSCGAFKQETPAAKIIVVSSESFKTLFAQFTFSKSIEVCDTISELQAKLTNK